MDQNQKKFYVQTTEDQFTGSRTIVFPKYVKEHKLRHQIVHGFIAVVFGISVPYFLIDFSHRVYRYFVPLPVQATNVAPFVNQGSNDVATTTEDTTTSNGVQEIINPEQKGQYYFTGSNYKIPTVSADAYVVADIDTGEVIIDKNPDKIYPIASVSKLITAVVAKENMDQTAAVTVNRSSIETYGTSGGLREGEKIRVSDLYYPLLMESSNDAAVVFAYGYPDGYDAFVKKMNDTVAFLGMAETTFVEPSGLSEKNVSSAKDLQILMRYITKKHPDIWDITRVKQYSILNHTWGDGSSIAKKSTFIGGKNGFTYEAHTTTASLFTLPVEGGTRRIAISLLMSDSREADVDALIRFVTKWVGYLPEGAKLPNS